jgi:cytidine deaminase
LTIGKGRVNMPISDDVLAAMAELARSASEKAYCPYSRFPVGAAVLTSTGEIVQGCNVENASYGLTICAERNAVFQAVARGARELVAIAVFTPTPTPTAPCGACRQVLYEFGPGAEFIGICNGLDIIRGTVAGLLPHAFGPDNL